jgi:hypothetical protein
MCGPSYSDSRKGLLTAVNSLFTHFAVCCVLSVVDVCDVHNIFES